MAGWAVIEVKVIHPEKYTEYVSLARPIVESYQCRYLARGGAIAPISGDWNPERMIIIRFPSRELLTGCFHSPEYRALVPLRDAAIGGKAVMVDGFKD